jgi:protein-S-isoprenylcysteine O-methyltransferase Ste14
MRMGLVIRGPYRLVRHPVYLGELISILGMVVATLSPALFGLFLATIALQYWRTINEERALAEVFPEYGEYRRETPRLVPFLRRMSDG